MSAQVVENPAGAAGSLQGKPQALVNGGRFDFDDGGTYCGGWEDGKAHGHGVCTGPKGQGAYSGSWHFGFEVSGVYTWPSGSAFEGQWQNGKRHGLGVEQRGRWLYRGEWTQGFKGRYGVRQSSTSNARYEGTWANGLQDGYGSETYADGGTYQGQWMRGMRHGYGVRASAPFGMASHYRPNKTAVRASMTSLRSSDGAATGPGAEAAAERDRRVDDSRGGFVLKAHSDEPPQRRNSLVEKSTNIKRSIFSKIRKQRSTGDLEKRGGGGSASIRSTGSTASWMSTESSASNMTHASAHTDSNASFVVEDEHLDASVTETFMGEWKNDKRSGFGISERSDGLRYEGEWFNNKKYGYGVTTFRDGSKEEGKYKNNVLITSQKKKHLFLIRSAKFRERIDAAVNAAQRASKIALQKADIAISRTATARGKAESADMAADHAREDCDLAKTTAKQFAPDFNQQGLDKPRLPRDPIRHHPPSEDAMPGKSILQNKTPTIPSGPSLTQSNDISAQQKAQTQAAIQQMQQALQQQKLLEQRQQEIQKQQQDQLVQQQRDQQNSLMRQQQEQQILLQQQQQMQQQVLMQHQQQQLSQPLPSSQEEKPYTNKVESSRAPSVTRLAGTTPQSRAGSVTSLRRGPTIRTSSEDPNKQSLNDRFDQYKRPPSRDSSVDRYTRAASRLNSRQPSVPRQPSVDRTSLTTPGTGTATPIAGNGSAIGAGAIITPAGVSAGLPTIPPFEEVLMRKKGLGQDILPSPGQPKRTESLYLNPGGKGAVAAAAAPAKAMPVSQPLQRKKSLPDVQAIPIRGDGAMSREEVSVLSSARREEVRRQQDEAEKLRANPLLWLISPQVKEWFCRQQLVLLVLFINIALGIMFFKMLT